MGSADLVTTAAAGLLITALSACGSSGPKNLVIRQEVSGGAYAEGHYSYLTLNGPGGSVLRDKRFAGNPLDGVLLTTHAPTGDIEVISYQRACDANCGQLDPPMDTCSAHVTVTDGTVTDVTVHLTPGRGCTISPTGPGA